jgi:hypothetical protein
MSVALVVSVAFLYGVTNKLADMMNEHGLRWFRGAATGMGFVWGGFGVVLTLYSPEFATLYLGLTLSWFLSLKLDYPNHAIAGVATVLAAVWMAAQDGLDVLAAGAVMVAYRVTGLVQAVLRGRAGWLDRLLRVRLRLYLIPLGYAVYVGHWLPFAAGACGMLGAELVTNYYRIVRNIR